MPPLESWLPFAVLFAEVLALVGLGRLAAGHLSRLSLSHELTTRDNGAFAVALAGYHLGLFLALAGLLSGETRDLGRDAILVGVHGLVAIPCLLVSASIWRPVFGVDLRRDLAEGRNLAAGIVCGCGLAATGLVYGGAVQGDNPGVTGGFFRTELGGSVAALIFFALGQGALFLTSLLYEWITPYDVEEEVTEKGNVAAALGFGGALLATGIVVAHAAAGDLSSWEESVRDFARLLVPLAGLPLVRWIVADGLLLGFRNVNREISADRNLAAGLLEAVAYVGCAILVTRLL